MPPTTGVNLKQVAKQFNDALYVIREDAPGIEALEPQAIAWLKDARYTIMCKLEEAFNQLEASREKPPQLLDQLGWSSGADGPHASLTTTATYTAPGDLTVPWATLATPLRPKWIDPSHRLYLATDSIPIELRPYAEEFRKNLHVLLLNCDFTSCTASISMFGHIELSISFPAVTRALCVEDEFSRASGRESRGTFSAARFAGPLRDLRGAEDVELKKNSESSQPVATATSKSEEDETDEGSSFWELETDSDGSESSLSDSDVETSI
ncbi:hypothetical protein C8J57DRAFT_1538622 [Mycena rebaudengoi]|nr:hypothetical protein C8J57DRAFT_1538622 [Mycena rebaudengoi]